MTRFLFIFATACCILKKFHPIYIGIFLEITGMHVANSKDSGVDQLFAFMCISQVLLFSETVNDLQSKQSRRVQKKPFALADNILVSLIIVSLNILKIFCCKSFLYVSYNNYYCSIRIRRVLEQTNSKNITHNGSQICYIRVR